MNTLLKIEHGSNMQSMKDFLNAVLESQLKHYASDLFPELEMIDNDVLNHALRRAQQVCSTLNLPVRDHFKRIYRTDGNNTYCDYRLSHTAYLLVSINGDVSRKKVAQIQMELVKSLI
jgi:hypothetical protein